MRGMMVSALGRPSPFLTAIYVGFVECSRTADNATRTTAGSSITRPAARCFDGARSGAVDRPLRCKQPLEILQLVVSICVLRAVSSVRR